MSRDYKKLISIIIPCYNCETYIKETIKSLKNQSSKNFEVIFINDGSVDETANIISNEIKLIDIKCKLINKKNEGVSVARNTGLKAANGDYVYFLDGDDSVESNFIEEISKILNNKKELDILFFGYRRIYKNKIIELNNSGNINDKKHILEEMLKNKFNFHMCSVIFKKDLLEKHSISFIRGRTYGEDHEFIIAALMNSTDVLCINNIFFNYCIRDNSAVGKFTLKRLDSVNAAIDTKNKVVEKYIDLEALANLYVAEKITYNLRELVKVDKKVKIDKIIKTEFLNNIKEHKGYFKFLKAKNDNSLKTRIKYLVINLNVNLYLNLLYIENRR